MKTLGLIGGIGPESTIEYYRLLVSGYRARIAGESAPPLLIKSIGLNKMLALVAGDRDQLVEYLAGNVQQLAHAGANFALLVDSVPLGIPFLDTTRIHVDAALDEMLS